MSIFPSAIRAADLLVTAKRAAQELAHRLAQGLFDKRPRGTGSKQQVLCESAVLL
jgi:hypothetical protein